MNNAQENSYDKPDFWHGDNDSFTVYLKQAALDIKHLMATPNNIVFAAWGRWLARVILKIIGAKRLKNTLRGTIQRVAVFQMNRSI